MGLDHRVWEWKFEEVDAAVEAEVESEAKAKILAESDMSRLVQNFWRLWMPQRHSKLWLSSIRDCIG